MNKSKNLAQGKTQSPVVCGWFWMFCKGSCFLYCNCEYHADVVALCYTSAQQEKMQKWRVRSRHWLCTCARMGHACLHAEGNRDSPPVWKVWKVPDWVFLIIKSLYDYAVSVTLANDRQRRTCETEQEAEGTAWQDWEKKSNTAEREKNIVWKDWTTNIKQFGMFSYLEIWFYDM